MNIIDTWMDEIISFLKEGILPSGEKEAHALKKKSGWFVWHERNLYKKFYTHPLQKCVTPFEGNYILRDIHEGVAAVIKRPGL